MNINYLYSIIKLYVQREKNHRAVLIINKQDEEVEFSLSMQENSQDKTFITLPLDIVLAEKANILKLYRQEKIVLDEKYQNNIYTVTFNNGRKVMLKGFSLIEINDWRNALFEIQIRKEELRLPREEKETPTYNSNHSLQMAGFTSYVTLFFSVLLISSFFIAGLWLCKMFF